MKNLNLGQLFALTVIADAGSLSAAAARVFLSQSALTQSLRKIESAAGLPLFERLGNGVTPTTAGHYLIRRSEKAFTLLDSAKRRVRQGKVVHPGHKKVNAQVTTSQLKALIAIVATGGYSLAARKLGLAQPTIYRAAKELEARIGTQLFKRTSRGVEASDAARLLAQHAELAFGEIRQGFEEISEMRGLMSSRVAVGCLPLARVELLPRAVTRLLQVYPDARVSIMDGPYTEQLHALRYGHIDWIIGALREPVPTPDIVQQHLFEEPLAIVVRILHPLLGSTNPTPAILAELEWIAPRRHTPARDLFEVFFTSNGVEIPKRIIECSSLITIRGLLQDSDRAALLSPSQVRRDVATNQLAVVGEPLPDTNRPIGLTVRTNWEPTLVQSEFSRIIQQQVMPVA